MNFYFSFVLYFTRLILFKFGIICGIQDIRSMLKGNYNISWEISPNNEIKKRADMLKRFATLSIEMLHVGTKPCPLIVLEVCNRNQFSIKLFC